MSREIESITNVVSYAILVNDKWTYTGNFPPSPDEIVIRQITYSSEKADPRILLVNSSVGLLGSIVAVPSYVSNPGTRIKVRNPISNPLEFWLSIPTQGSMMPAANVDDDYIAIHMDFIKYR